MGSESAPLGDLGAAIAQTRVEKGLSRDKVRRAARISVEYLGKIERGKSVPQPGKLAAIAAALDTTPAELITRAQTLRLSQQLATQGKASEVGGVLTGVLLSLLGLPLGAAAVPAAIVAGAAAYRARVNPAQELANLSREQLVSELERKLGTLSKDQLIALLLQLLEAQD